MARTRTIRRAPIKTSRKKTQKRKKANSAPWPLSILPEGLQAFFARRLVDVTSAFFALGGAFLLVALATYNPHDPAANVAASQNGTVENWMGLYGAWSADILLQTVGVAAFMIGLVAVCWGVRIFNRATINWFPLRISLWASAYFSLPWLSHRFRLKIICINRIWAARSERYYLHLSSLF